MKSGNLSTPISFFFLKMVVSVLGLLCFYINFSTSLLISLKKNLTRILIGIASIYASIWAILTILSHPVHGHGILLHLYSCPLIFFAMFYCFQCTGIRNISLNLLLYIFDAIVNFTVILCYIKPGLIFIFVSYDFAKFYLF